MPQRATAVEPPVPDLWLESLEPIFQSRLVPGPALDVACGSGSNALWLASKGVRTLGVDISPDSIRAANARARSLGTPARFEVRDLELEGLPPGPWGAALVFHYLQRSLFRSLEASLSPGGLLVYKTHMDHGLRGSGVRPRRPEFRLRPGELLAAFPALEPLEYREWAVKGKAYAALLARKRA